jgi:fatty-acyl-CoA synthase
MVPVPMYPLFGARASNEFLKTASSILSVTESKLLIADILPEELVAVANQAGVARIVGSGEVAQKQVDGAYQRPGQVTADSACFLQFTSGSTRSPKGVQVSHGNLIANSHAIMVDGLRCNPEVDKPVCWLPLYHDMGLIGHVVAPLTIGMSVVFIPTLAFISRPSVWMQSVHKHRGTIVFGPNFALALAARRPPDLAQLDLSGLRVVGCGAEPIHAATLRNFLAVYEPCGLRPEAIMPCYGLAEATLAVSFESLERPARIIAIDRVAY